jgi:flagellar assembly protein FliH
MAMIRQANASTMARDAVVLDLGDLTRQADQIRARARAEAELILGRARAQREQILAGAAEEGRQLGFAQGLEEGRSQGRDEGRAELIAELQPRLAALEHSWNTALGEFQQARHALVADARHEALELAVRMGQLVTKRILDISPGVVLDQVSAVLSLVIHPSRLRIAVHPDDLPLVQEALPSLCARFNGRAHVELVPDETLSPGSCIARTAGDGRAGGGEIDASIDTQLQRIVEVLLPAPVSALPIETSADPGIAP